MIHSPSTEATSISPRLEGDTPAGQARLRPVTEPIRVLMLEDSEADAELIHAELRRAGLMPLIERVDSAEKFASALTHFVPDVVLSEYALAQADAQAAY